MSNQDYQSKYLKRARRAVALLKLNPSILLVGISGSLASGQATEKSDIDFFVVCRTGRIYSCRFFAKLILWPWARRNRDPNPADKICLNYFLSEKSLDFKPHSDKVIHYHQHAIILFSRGEILKKMTTANSWLKPAFELRYHKKYRYYGYQNLFGQLIEKALKSYQNQRIDADTLTQMYPENIIYNDQELRFHPPKKENGKH